MYLRSPAYGRGPRGGDGGGGGGGGGTPHHKVDRAASAASAAAQSHAPREGGGFSDESLSKGVYKNKMFTFAASSVIGAAMRVDTADGKTFEGIFVTWSPGMDVVLEQVHEVKEGGDGEEGGGAGNVDPASIHEKMVFGPQQYVSLHCVDVDLDYAMKGEAVKPEREFEQRSNSESVIFSFYPPTPPLPLKQMVSRPTPRFPPPPPASAAAAD